MPRHAIAARMLGLVGTIVGVLASGPDVAAADAPVEISPFVGKLCLQPLNESPARGAAIVQVLCTGSAAQLWDQKSVGGGLFHYVNRLSGLCLDARGGAVNHTPVQQWPCSGISNENWQPGDGDSDTIPPLYARVSGAKNYCLDQPGAQQNAGLAMQIYRCNGTVAQDWWIAPPH